MLHKTVILKRANVQFQSICDYLVEQFGERVADSFVSEVETCVASILKFPESGHPEPLIGKYQYRSKIVGKHNKLYYYVDNDTLVIAAFTDMRMHPNRIKNIVSNL